MLKEVFDALAQGVREISDFLDVRVFSSELGRRNGEDLSVVAGFIFHAQHAHGLSDDHRARQQRVGGDHQHVRGVPVLREGLRHVAIVAGIEHRRSHETVNEDGAGDLVHFVLHWPRSCGDFDDNVYFSGLGARGRH